MAFHSSCDSTPHPSSERFSEGREPVTFIDHLRIRDGKNVFVIPGLAIQHERLELTMSCGDQRASRGFINAARLHADHAILNAVGAADTICSGNLVQIFQKLHGPDAVSVETDGNPLLEI